MEKRKGAAFTGVILMVLVMTLIGVPLLGMVVFNYRYIELNNSLKRSEYENEMAMDVISRIIRETVIDAINTAKEGVTGGVNEIAELQKTSYSSSNSKYQSLWLNEFNAWVSNSDEYNPDILAGFLTRITDESGSDDDDERREWWRSVDTPRDEIQKEEMDKYVAIGVSNDMKDIEGDYFTPQEKEEIGSLLDSEGTIDEEKLAEAYNMVFKRRYETALIDNLCGNIAEKSHYVGIVSEGGIVDTAESEDLTEVENYLKINPATVREPEFSESGKIEVDVGTRFKKNKTTPPTTLSATFVISTPDFDGVSSVTQETITLSNALLNQGGVIVGGKLTLVSDSKLYISNNLTVLGKDEDTAIELGQGSILKAGESDEDVSNSRIATAKDILLSAGTTFSTGSSPIYYRNLYVGNSGDGDIKIDFNGDVVAEDDLEIDHEGKVEINQSETANYYGFNDTNNKGPDSSSSIVINSQELSNKSISLGNLYLAGRAFIEDVKGTENTPIYGEDGETIVGYADTTYKTGESVAIKGNYIAYQTPLFDPTDPDYMFSPDKLKFSTYFLSRKEENSEKKYSTINLADKFVVSPPDFKGSFDVNYKWRYFAKYAELYKDSILKKIKLKSNVRYVEGIVFDEAGGVVESSNKSISDTSFRNNLETEYEKYTKYFGYRPVDENGNVTGDAKSEIFGNNGWIKSFNNSDINDENYYQIYANGDESISLTGNDNNGIIVCKGDLYIEVDESAIFSGIIIVGGNLTVDGKSLTLKDGKEQVINTIINNYLGNNNDITGGSDKLYDTFVYDGSGSSYIVTEIGEGLININDLIGITNWKKSNYGRF